MNGELAPLLAAAASAAGVLALLSWGRYLRSRRSLHQRLRLARPLAPVPLGAWAARIDASRPFLPLAAALAGTGVRLRPSVVFALAAAAVIMTAYLAAGATGLSLPVTLLVAVPAVAYGGRRLLALLRDRQAEAVDGQLVEACRLLSGALHAGLSVPQGLELLAVQLPAPAGAYFRRLSGEVALGIPLDAALADFCRRLPSNALRLLVLAITLNSRMGGDLARALTEISDTLAERQRVLAAVAAATAEPRFVAAVLPFMPLAAAVALNLIIPGFLRPLFTHWGLVLLAVCGCLQLLGFAAIRHVCRIRL